MDFDVYVFDAKTLCCNEFVIDPKSANFLTKHGFNFNHLFQSGLPFDSEEREDVHLVRQSNLECSQVSIRLVLLQIIKHCVPLVVHNGFCDLAFLYHQFYNDLPSSVGTFQQDLNDLFRGGIFDTKNMSYSSEFLSCSYLNYIFKKIQRENITSQTLKQKYLKVKFPKFDKLAASINIPCLLGEKFKELMNGENVSLKPSDPICEKFAQSGYCNEQPYCEKSHNVDDVLDAEYYYTYQRTAKCPKLEPTKTQWKAPENISVSFGHRAGFDSFITGYCFAYFLLDLEKPGSENDPKLELTGQSQEFLEANFNIKDVRNKIALVKRNSPFVLLNSNFTKMSTSHMKKAAILFCK